MITLWNKQNIKLGKKIKTKTQTKQASRDELFVWIVTDFRLRFPTVHIYFPLYLKKFLLVCYLIQG